MRLTAIAITATLLATVTASAQTQPSRPHPYGLDPYNPSDAALLRNYGSTLVAQTPLLELRRLDPFRPSDAALLRQLGGGIPIWGPVWYPAGPGFAPLTPFPAAGAPGEVDTAGPTALGIAPTDRLPPARIAPEPFPKHDPLPRRGPNEPRRNIEARATAE